MAGGKGTRMASKQEKLLLEYKKPIILHVIDALKSSGCFSKVLATTSDNSPNTHKLLETCGIEIIKTKGDGYVYDLNMALSNLKEPTLVVSGDMPLLDENIIKEIISHYNNTAWQSFLVTKKFLDSMNLVLEFSINYENKQCYYTGVSMVDPKQISSMDIIKETFHVMDDKRIVINLNTKRDYDLLKTA